MAITAASLQSQFTDGTKVLMELAPYGAPTQQWLIQCGTGAPGVTKMFTTTAANNAATQASTVNTKKAKGSGGHD